ncbi:MAG: zinc ribbon domain-containing protein [Anaerolineae bacterium]
MPFFDRLKGEADKAAFEANRMMRVNSVQSEIGGLKGQLQARRDELGAAVYELFKAQQLTEPKLIAICEAMRTTEAAIAAKEKDIENIRHEKAPDHTAPVAKPASPMPGAPIPGIPTMVTAPAAVANAPAPAAGEVYGHICSNEKVPLPANVMFCPNCGAKAIDVPPPAAQASTAAPAPAATPGVCPNCQNPLAPNATFCPNCGARVSPA